MDNNKLRETAQRLVEVRSSIVREYPFFGRLIMHLPFAFAPCTTAYTDMKKIVFDPDFASSLSDSELTFVVMHELMHCVLKHCTRAKGRLGLIYNIACDIVVNSVILEAMSLKDFSIRGSKVMHLVPNQTEGRKYSAEEVYRMLIQASPPVIQKLEQGLSLDSHEIWQEIEGDPMLEKTWETHIKKASSAAGNVSCIPDSLKRHVVSVARRSVIDWKQVLCDFICSDRHDFVYDNPDRRFSGDVIMPGFMIDTDSSSTDNIWFLVDTSGSVDDETLSKVFDELKSATAQIDYLSGYVSFFDCEVTEPAPFEGAHELEELTPLGGGGTSFSVIFEKLDEFFDQKPRAIVILTDGYADFPAQGAAMGIPVIWIICGSGVKAPWGECVQIYP